MFLEIVFWDLPFFIGMVCPGIGAPRVGHEKGPFRGQAQSRMVDHLPLINGSAKNGIKVTAPTSFAHKLAGQGHIACHNP